MGIHCVTYSAIIEHTNRVIYLEDDDVAAVDATGSKILQLHNSRD